MYEVCGSYAGFMKLYLAYVMDCQDDARRDREQH